MGISEKARSLYCGMPGGGFRFKTDPDGVVYLPLESMPYELEEIFVTWADAQPTEYDSALRHVRNGIVIGISTEAWERFAKWMLTTLKAATKT